MTIPLLLHYFFHFLKAYCYLHFTTEFPEFALPVVLTNKLRLAIDQKDVQGPVCPSAWLIVRGL